MSITPKDFKEKLKENGQTMKWFYDKRIKEKTGLTYGGFAAQLNGYATVSDSVNEEIKKYVEQA